LGYFHFRKPPNLTFHAETCLRAWIVGHFWRSFSRKSWSGWPWHVATSSDTQIGDSQGRWRWMKMDEDGWSWMVLECVECIISYSQHWLSFPIPKSQIKLKRETLNLRQLPFQTLSNTSVSNDTYLLYWWYWRGGFCTSFD
jgi:hypothetical protein